MFQICITEQLHSEFLHIAITWKYLQSYQLKWLSLHLPGDEIALIIQYLTLNICKLIRAISRVDLGNNLENCFTAARNIDQTLVKQILLILPVI